MKRSRHTELASLVGPTEWTIFLVTLGLGAFLSLAFDIEFMYLAIVIAAEILVLGILLPILRMSRIRDERDRTRRERFEQYREELERRGE